MRKSFTVRCDEVATDGGGTGEEGEKGRKAVSSNFSSSLPAAVDSAPVTIAGGGEEGFWLV